MKTEIIEQFAQTLWALGWADWQDELDSEDPRKVNLSGCEITEVMDPIPDSVNEQAADLFDRLDRLNGGSLVQLCEQVTDRDGSDLDYLAHYLIMESCGHGVAYSDDYPEHGIQVLSYLEILCFDGSSLDVCA